MGMPMDGGMGDMDGGMMDMDGQMVGDDMGMGMGMEGDVGMDQQPIQEMPVAGDGQEAIAE